MAYASYFGRRSIGSIRGIGETGVQIDQIIGPVLSGLAFDINALFYGGHEEAYYGHETNAIRCHGNPFHFSMPWRPSVDTRHQIAAGFMAASQWAFT